MKQLEVITEKESSLDSKVQAEGERLAAGQR